ncbi:aminoglycoside phosphotransferase family protein [Oceanobacillus piezotolerans]|uniref:Aminoglycoside phosphotransferase family protein n=1 Tax=Oceanobacillus piezotolerans TaxID=2448030 RepID=A0A498DDN9_9BACI|nr:aminoglycoside phosphotransferase family protein [Oceanobacillus piezotolerans]RLL48322.1 aminoglycoside phosphotransferase family protein [Oceanobacillus piezotolerans]
MNLGVPFANGYTAEIFLHEGRIFKVFKDHLPLTESMYEANKQSLAYSLGLNVPKIIDVTKINGKQAIIMEYVKGKTIGEIVSKNMDRAEYYMNISVDIQRKIHKVVADSFEPMIDRLRHQIARTIYLEEQHKSQLIAKLESMTFENRLCHGDYHLFNLIITENDKVTIIDWVDSSAGDIRADIYRTYLLYSQFSEELAELYLRLYLEKSGLSKKEIFEWAPIMAAARLSENVSTENSERLMEIIHHYFPL